MYINKTVKEIQISDIRKIYEKMQTHENPLNMSLGEPDIDVPDFIIKILKEVSRWTMF